VNQARHELIAEGLSSANIDAWPRNKVVPGNNPSNTLMMQQLTPDARPMMACTEHAPCTGRYLDLDSFDQWGVELGSSGNKNILAAPAGPAGQRQTR